MTLFTNIKRKLGTGAIAIAFAVTSVVAPWAGMAQKAFAVAPNTPTNVRLATGGNSVAVMWEPPTSGATPTGYYVYRGGVLKATVAPSTANYADGNTQRWLDTAVTNGTTYTYYVSAINADGESAWTSGLNITHTSTPAVPTVTIDPSTPATLTTYSNNIKALLQAWYPKIVWKLGSPAGTSTSITIKPVSGLGNIAQTSGNLIEYDEAWALGSLTDQAQWAVFLHESTHVAQLSGTGTHYLPWAHEGMADYMEQYFYGDKNNQTINNTTAHWLAGYNRVAYFLNWITNTYSKPNFVKDFDASFATDYSLTFFKTQTGLTVGELWQNMTGRKLSSPTFFKNVAASKKCLELTGQQFNPPAFAPIKLATACNNGETSQQFEWLPDSSTSNQGELRVLTLPGTTCVDVTGSGTTNGTPVTTYTCNGGVAQKWILMPDGSLKNPNSGKCMQPVGGAITAGTSMEISTCTGADIQDWFQRPIGLFKIQYGLGCLASAPTTPLTVYDCGEADSDYQFSFNPISVGSTTGTIKGSAGTCMRPIGGSTSTGIKMEMATCTGAATQNWQWQSDNTVKNIGSGLCLGLPAWASPYEVTQSTCASPTSLKKWDPLYQY